MASVCPLLRAFASRRSVTTRVMRSTCSRQERASARTSSWEETSSISSMRMDSAVSGVRSWWEASAANWRSAARRPAMRSPVRASSSDTRSISSMPEDSTRARTCPEPICSAWAAR